MYQRYGAVCLGLSMLVMTAAACGMQSPTSPSDSLTGSALPTTGLSSPQPQNTGGQREQLRGTTRFRLSGGLLLLRRRNVRTAFRRQGPHTRGSLRDRSIKRYIRVTPGRSPSASTGVTGPQNTGGQTMYPPEVRGRRSAAGAGSTPRLCTNKLRDRFVRHVHVSDHQDTPDGVKVAASRRSAGATTSASAWWPPRHAGPGASFRARARPMWPPYRLRRSKSVHRRAYGLPVVGGRRPGGRAPARGAR